MKYLVFFRNIWNDSLVVEPSAQLCFLPQSRAFYDQNFTSVESLWPQHIITSGLLFTALFFIPCVAMPSVSSVQRTESRCITAKTVEEIFILKSALTAWWTAFYPTPLSSMNLLLSSLGSCLFSDVPQPQLSSVDHFDVRVPRSPWV